MGAESLTGRSGVHHNGDSEKTAMQIRWRGKYQQLLKVDPLKCILCGSQMHFTGLKRGYRYRCMSRWRECGCAAEGRRGEVASILRETEQKTAIHTLNQSEPSSLIVGSVHMEQKWC